MTAVSRNRQAAAGLLLGTCSAVMAIVPGWQVKVGIALLLLTAPIALWLLHTPHRWLAAFIVSAWILPPLPVHLGDSGPHVALLIALGGLLAGVLRLPEWRFQLDRLTSVLLAFFAVLLASSALAAIYSGPTLAVASFARVLLFGISVYTFLYVRNGPFIVTPGFTRTLFLAAVASSAIACLDFYFQFSAPAGFGAQFIWLDGAVFRRAQGVFYEASTLGNVCVFILDMIVVALFASREMCPLPRWVLALGGVPLIAALILSYSRASAVALGVGIAVLMWLRRESIPVRRYVLFAVVVGAACYGLLVAFVPTFAQNYWLRLYSSVRYFGVAPDAVLSGRLQSWQALVGFLATHPWHALVGIGYKTLAYSDFTGAPTIADNAYLSSLVETGILGLVLLISLNVIILRYAYRAAKSDARETRFYGSWMLCFWAGEVIQMLSGDLLTYWRVLPAYFCILALATRANESAFSGPVQ
jgi:O-antigen ligase